MAKSKPVKTSPAIQWTEVVAPVRWDLPVGSELIGYYVRTREVEGANGTYLITQIKDARGVLWEVSGSMLVSLIEQGAVEPSTPVRVVFTGWKELGGDRTMRLFTLYTAPKGTVLP